MRNLKVITILALFLVALSATTLLAQRRPENTRSAQAAYGYPAGGHKAKKSKKKKQKKPRKTKKQKSSPAYRKKNPWAN